MRPQPVCRSGGAVGFLGVGGEDVLFQAKLLVSPEAEPGRLQHQFFVGYAMLACLSAVDAEPASESIIRRIEKVRGESEMSLIARACREFDQLTTVPMRNLESSMLLLGAPMLCSGCSEAV